MRVHLFTGPLNYTKDIVDDIADEDIVIGADQAVLFLMKEQIRCDIAVGDFDSVTEAEQDSIGKYAKEVVTHPIKKDFTDTYLALEEALKRYDAPITIYGGLGGRFDHSYANMMLLKLGDVSLKTEYEIMYVLNPGEYKIDNDKEYISFFALDDVYHLTLTGFLYELHDIELNVDDPLCISNQGSGTVAFDEGTLLVIHQGE